MKQMKCLSVRQPWAYLIAAGIKTKEIRTWSSSYRGELVIVASATPARAGKVIVNGYEFTTGELCDMLEEKGQLHLGASVCVTSLLDVSHFKKLDVKDACTPYFPDHKAWSLGKATPIIPNPMKGKLNVYTAKVPIYKAKGFKNIFK
jgi:hypothetical protein